MNLSKLLHQILYHTHKILTKQHFLTENVSPEIFHQLFMLFVCWWWVGKLGPFAQRRGGSLHFQSDSWEQEPLCSFTQLHRNSVGTQNLGRSLPRVPWEFLLLPDSSVEENEDFGAAKKHCTSKTPVSGKNTHKMWDLWALRGHTWGNQTNVTHSQKRPSIKYLTSRALFHTYINFA